jgi:hypothetical protein
MIQRFDKVIDGGQRTTFSTGAQREISRGGLRFDLIAMVGLFRLAMHYGHGAIKYADRNWEKGLPLSSFMKSAMSHIVKYMMGDRSEDHWAAVAWNAFGFMHTEAMIEAGKLPKALNDIPDLPFGFLVEQVTMAHGILPDAGTVRGPHRAGAAGGEHGGAKARPRKLPRPDRKSKRGDTVQALDSVAGGGRVAPSKRRVSRKLAARTSSVHRAHLQAHRTRGR